MWKSLRSVGLGTRFRWGHYVLALLIIVGAAWIWIMRAHMFDARSPFAAIRFLQALTPVLYAGPALIAIALLPVADEMEGGALAVSLRYLIAFHLVRTALLAVTVTPGLALSPAWMLVRSAVTWSYTWLFVLGVAHRWQLTATATELDERYQINPESEVAVLSRGVEPGHSRPR
jgi:hypothetical protein